MSKPTLAISPQQLSDALAGIVDRASSSVVAVHSARSRSSGFVWRQGLIVTADEALDDEGGITVVLPGGETLAANLVGRDPTTDVALLLVDRRSTSRRATSVVGSRPTRFAASVSPPGNTTVMPPSSSSASSAVTIKPCRQTNPLERERAEWTATTLDDARSTMPASASDSCCGETASVGFDMGSSSMTTPIYDARSLRSTGQMSRF